MGPDPAPELHRGVELIIRSIARMAGRQHSKKHSHNTVFAQRKQGPLRESSTSLGFPFIMVLLTDSDVPTTLRNLRDAFGTLRWFCGLQILQHVLLERRLDEQHVGPLVCFGEDADEPLGVQPDQLSAETAA